MTKKLLDFVKDYGRSWREIEETVESLDDSPLAGQTAVRAVSRLVNALEV